ncbi:hypothetical protein ABZ440_51295, partial [Nonomuraea sp. NPDC005701]
AGRRAEPAVHLAVDDERRAHGVEAGITMPFLTPADDAAGRVYARVGYHKAGEVLHISAP